LYFFGVRAGGNNSACTGVAISPSSGAQSSCQLQVVGEGAGEEGRVCCRSLPKKEREEDEEEGKKEKKTKREGGSAARAAAACSQRSVRSTATRAREQPSFRMHTSHKALTAIVAKLRLG
jgi:hypothetical protein